MSNLSKKDIFLSLAKPDSDGFSRIVGIEELEREGLGLGNGGSWCRDDGPLAKIYNVVRHKEMGRIIGVELQGYKKSPIQKPIPPHIRKKIISQRCAVLAISKVECDHKDGRRDDPRLSDITRVQMDDFQPLSKAANSAKRQHCINCKKTNKRFDAKRLGYAVSQWKGDKTYRGTCIGCYWYSPKRFNEEVSKNYNEGNRV